MLNHWIVHLVSVVLFCCFRVLWNLKERITNPDIKTGARIFDIAFRHNLDTICMPSSLSYFCISFKEVLPLSSILEENVYLYCYDSQEVAFVVVEPGKEIWRSECSAFYKTAQYIHAKQIIVISLQDFFTVCEDLPHPGSKLNFVHFVPRSGSTLLIQMFEATGKCIAVSEPDDFIPDPAKLKPGITHEEKVQLFRAIGKYVTRSVNNDKYKHYFAKVQSAFTIPYYDFLRESFPESKHVFLHRDFKATLKSSLHSYPHFPFMKVLEGLVNYVPSSADKIRNKFFGSSIHSGHLSPKEVEQLLSLWYKHKPYTGSVIYGYCTSYDFFLNKKQMPAIKYDDLVGNRTENTKKILEHFELPLDLVEKAVEAMERDSQRNSLLARNKIGDRGSADLEDGVRLLAEEFCNLFNIPGLRGDQRHTNTITVAAP